MSTIGMAKIESLGTGHMKCLTPQVQCYREGSVGPESEHQVPESMQNQVRRDINANR